MLQGEDARWLKTQAADTIGIYVPDSTCVCMHISGQPSAILNTQLPPPIDESDEDGMSFNLSL